MNEDFVSFDLAKKLKNKGFPQYTEKSYFVGDHKKRMCSVGTFLHVHTQNTEHLIAAPTISQVLKWLREEKKMHIMIAIYSHYPQGTHDWGYELINLQTHTCKYFNYEYSSYEAAALAGIEYVIDNLI